MLPHLSGVPYLPVNRPKSLVYCVVQLVMIRRDFSISSELTRQDGRGKKTANLV